MRKVVNISALIFFILLVLDAFNMPDAFLNFLLIGELPGTTVSLPPTMMLAIMTALIGLIVFELAARKVEVIRRIRYHLTHLILRHERLPKRRFSHL